IAMFENRSYIIIYIISNIIGLVFLLFSLKWQRLTRLLFALLFGGACYVNMRMANTDPGMYLDYAQLSVPAYAGFINGWFIDHIATMVSLVAAGQGLIAIAILLKGIWVKLALVGIVIFLLAIAPLGIGSGFPFSLTVSLA